MVQYAKVLDVSCMSIPLHRCRIESSSIEYLCPTNAYTGISFRNLSEIWRNDRRKSWNKTSMWNVAFLVYSGVRCQHQKFVE